MLAGQRQSLPAASFWLFVLHPDCKPHFVAICGYQYGMSIIKPRSRRLGGFLLCTRFMFLFFVLNRAAVGWAVSCFALRLCFFLFVLNRSRRLGGFLLCTPFMFFFFCFKPQP